MLTHCPSPRPLRGEVSPEFLVPPVGKENPKRTTRDSQHCRLLCGSPYSYLAPQGNLRKSTTENLLMMEKEGRACNNQHMDLGKWVCPCSTQVVIPTCGLLIFRTKWVVHSDQGSWWGADLPYWDPQMSYFGGPRPGLSMPRQGARSWVTAPSAVGNVSWPHLTRGPGGNTWKLCSPLILEPRSEQVELIAPRAKAVLGRELPCYA